MRHTPALVLVIPLLAGLAGCAARAPGGGGLEGAARTAQQQADVSADPVAAKLAVWLRAQIPGAATASEIDGFLQANPDWPGQPLLNQRLQQALATEPDDQVARALCAAHPPDMTASLLRCMAALTAPPASPGQPNPGTREGARKAVPAAIASAAIAAWVGGIDDEAQEAEFLAQFAALPGASDQWRRFDRQEWSGSLAAAHRQIDRLAAADRPLATARLSLREGAAGADELAATLRGPASRDPAMLLDLARWLRRHERFDTALALWRGGALAAETRVTDAHRAAFWSEREALAREMLAARRDADALYLADDSVQTSPTTRLDSEFLSGWIELQRLHDPSGAATRFAALTTQSHATITTSRGFYWLGRALDAQGKPAEAREAYRLAATRPLTFYGQRSIALLFPGDDQALANRIEALRDPDWTREEAIRFAGLELARAATLLVAWNDPRHARAFLLRLDEEASSDQQHALGASFANRLGLPDVAVAIARNAGRRGAVLAQSGWPAPVTPPALPSSAAPLPDGLALSIMRQESSFDPDIVSPAGAYGLMQLMPATAALVAGESIDPTTLTDPQVNMTLGQSYLSALLQQFSGSVPYAAAAYNAGPRRVQQWLQQNGNPAAGFGAPASSAPTVQSHAPTPEPDAAMIDWIELIPFAETRNYVQRVMESETIYRLRAPRRDATPLAMAQTAP